MKLKAILFSINILTSPNVEKSIVVSKMIFSINLVKLASSLIPKTSPTMEIGGFVIEDGGFVIQIFPKDLFIRLVSLHGAKQYGSQ